MNGKRIFALKGNLIYTKEIGTISYRHYHSHKTLMERLRESALSGKFREMPIKTLVKG